MAQENLTFLTVRIGEQWFGIDLQHVIEVLWFVYLEELPSTRPEVLGLLTLRQMTMPVIDLRILFQEPNKKLTMYTPIVTMQIDNKSVAIVVDEALDIVTVSSEQLRPNQDSPYVQSVAQTPNRLIRILNIQKLHTTDSK